MSHEHEKMELLIQSGTRAAMDRIIDYATLIDMATGLSSMHSDCRCVKQNLSGWASWPIGYREEDFEKIGTLAVHSPEASTLDEYHPNTTSYWSDAAPIALQFYPYNQCTVWRCRCCGRIYLRHNDDGAYHVAPRVRSLQLALIVDATHVHGGQDSGE